ncbi:hypothetical protein HGI30_09950 [Paenibacillus albicereus]|uniref:Uncharacterized protein n=1 Tax=Paenibacillus albicereus TaxID=2726185 RepID=A0A6H2GXI0_9BACL|nr:hypothetical protein [Paenibacillus albicereus]QJC51838.1 hypothetical protein HGI30_09950 [Paenibacillus albicereus]
MRLGTFIAGGIAGAAATLYVARKRPGLASAAGVVAGQLWSGVVRKSMAGALRGGKGVVAASARSASPKPAAAVRREEDAPHAGDAQAWAQIAALVSSDPAVKKETDKLLAEAGAVLPPH